MKIGIVGTNFVSDSFVDGAKEFNEIEVVAVTSGHYENALKFANKYQIQNTYHSLDEMIDAHVVDVIYLAVPNAMHYEFAKKCIVKQIPVLCEKPFMANFKQAKDIFSLAAKNDVYIHDGIMPLYSKGMEVLKKSLPLVGKIHNAIIDFSKYSSRYDAYLEGKNPSTFQSELCNGSIMDLGVYCIADAISLFGKPRSIKASATLLDTGADVSSSAILEYDGFSTTILNSKASDTLVPCSIEGEKGILTFHIASLIDEVKFIDRKTKEEKVLFAKVENPFIAEIEDILESIKEEKKESTKVPHEISLSIISCMDEIRKQTGIIYPCDREGE